LSRIELQLQRCERQRGSETPRDAAHDDATRAGLSTRRGWGFQVVGTSSSNAENRHAMGEQQGSALLKRDVFGRVELLTRGATQVVRRVACGSRLPFSRWIAHVLLARERRALRALQGLEGVPATVDDAPWQACASPDGSVPDAREALVREYVRGAPLARAVALPENFFQELDALVAAVHARGVCHNDLHKEQNVLVGEDGYPWLVDFQLASVHAAGDRRFAARAREDLRHVEKHRRRYTRLGRGPGGAELHGAGRGLRRTFWPRAWRRLGKPVYNFVTRDVLGLGDGEVRRDSRGPWPRWTPPIGPRAR
jgi:hypothetical protein